MISQRKIHNLAISAKILEEPIRAIVRDSEDAYTLVERGGGFQIRQAYHLPRLPYTPYFPSKLLIQPLTRCTYSPSWIHSVLHGMGLTARVPTHAPQKLPMDWEAKLLLMTQQSAFLVAQHRIIPELVINFDQSGKLS
jgi:hypothetical protein